MVALFSKFYANIWVGFCLSTRKHFSQRFHFKANRKSINSSKKWYQKFSKYPPFERSACFYVTISGSFERFQYLNFETDFLKTGISEANVKTNRMVSKKWSYHKERSFARECFIFLKILFQFKNLLERVDLMYQRHKCPYSYFYKRWSFIWRCFFPVSIFKVL